MTVSERLADAERRSVQVYQQRTEIAQQQMQIQHQAAACDLELARLDGEIRAYQALLAADKV